MWGPGILVTTIYPNPFALTLSSSNLNITVGNGIGFDTTGEFTSINPNTTNSNVIAGIAGSTLPRFDLLVIEYAQVGDTPIPQPSDPLNTVDLNLHDDFTLRIIEGTPGATPVYPSYTGPGFIICGLQIPADATMSNQFLIDKSVSQFSRFGVAQQPVFAQVALASPDGTNRIFTIPNAPITGGSLAIYKSGTKCAQGEYTLSGTTITFNYAPAVGETLWAAYVENSPNSQNPVQGFTEIPGGMPNGTNRIFTLTQQPIYQAACNVYVDGRWIQPTEWSLASEQGGQSSIQFNVGSEEIPATGQTIEVQYFFNSWPNYVPPSSNSNYVRAVYGNYAAPVSIDPTVGIVPSSAQDQTWYVKPIAAGAFPITASPAIAAGMMLGQKITIKGVDPANYLSISSASSSGTNQNGIVNLTNNQAIQYEWDGAVWNENFRRN